MEVKKTKKLWFRSKRYGWGWTPVSTEGWLLTIAFALFISFVAVSIGQVMEDLQSSDNDTQIYLILLYVAVIASSTIAFVTVAVIKGEKPRWRWGRK